MKNIQLIIIGLLLTLLGGCGMKTVLLQDGRTKIPVNPNVYKNKDKFNTALLSRIDTGVVYEEFDQTYKVLKRLDDHLETAFYGVYRFYPDGKLNYFVIDRIESVNSNTFNPVYRGYRGVYYQEGDRIKFDLFAESNQLGWIDKLTGTFFPEGETLYASFDTHPEVKKMYIKRKLMSGYLNYKPNW